MSLIVAMLRVSCVDRFIEGLTSDHLTILSADYSSHYVIRMLEYTFGENSGALVYCALSILLFRKYQLSEQHRLTV